MHDPSSLDIDFEIDLAFNSFPLELVEDHYSAETIFFLTDPSQWELEVCLWIKYIRAHYGNKSPAIITSQSLFSTGIKFVDDSEISQLNKQWRNRNEPTDVLSFGVLDEEALISPGSYLELGDIVVSVDAADRQAQEHKHSLVRELRWLVSHGFLHLLGWDHPDSESLREMLQCQEQLLAINGNLSLLKL